MRKKVSNRLGALIPVSRFAKHRGGNVAILFGLLLLPVLFAAGSALDYSGATRLRTKLQVATDGASILLCLLPGTPTQANLQAAAQTYMQQYMGGDVFRVTGVAATTNPSEIQLSTASDFSTAIVRIASSTFSKIPVSASSRCFNQKESFEIALVLDNTGSMSRSAGGPSKMESAKTAASSFVNVMFDGRYTGPNTKISLVPFAAGVAVDPSTYRSAAWIDQGGRSSYHWLGLQGGRAAANAAGATNRFDAFNLLKASVPDWDWKGCFESLPYPLNVQDSSPTSANLDSYYVPMFAPDESGDGGQLYHTVPTGESVMSGNSYVNDENTSGSCAATTDEATRNGRICKYVPITNPQTSNGWLRTGPNFACSSRPLSRLTTARTTLLDQISQMQPYNSTNIHEGFMWGWRTISPNSVFADGASYTKPYNNKVIILMTDGANQWLTASNPILKSLYSASPRGSRSSASLGEERWTLTAGPGGRAEPEYDRVGPAPS